jgi:HEAT repeat protein
MQRIHELIGRPVMARAALSALALTLALGTLSNAGALTRIDSPQRADAPAPPLGRDARFGSPGEQEQPGASDLAAGRVAAMNSRWAEALDHFRTVLDNYPDGELADDAAYWTAQSLYELGRYEEAVTRVNEFLDRYPRSTLREDAEVVRLQAAEALVRRGNADYERYLRDAAVPQAPPSQRAPVPGRAPEAPQAPDSAAELRVMALDALIGMDPEAAWPVLQRLVSEESDPELRGRAVWLLSQVGTDEAFDLLVDLARNDTDPEVRGNALFWIGQNEERRDEALDLLIDVIESGGDEEFVGQALFGLGQSSSPRARTALEALARDTSKPSELRSQALFWLGQQGESLQLLRDIALNDPDEEMRGQALFGISQIDSPAASEVLLGVARSDASMEMRSNAIFWLGQREGEQAIDVLLELWDDVDDVEVHNQLLFALAQTNSARAIDHLVMVAKDETADPELRQQAVFWLGQSDDPRAKAALLEIIGGGVRP